MVGSSSISTSPAFTFCPSRTWIARTTPVSNGWITLVRPLGIILPCAEATISTSLIEAQATAAANTSTMVRPIARPTGDGGVSMISSAAGRNASSSLPRLLRGPGKGMIFLLASFMGAALSHLTDASLHAMQRSITAAASEQIFVGPVFDHPSALDRDDPIRVSQRGQAVCDDHYCSPFGDFSHVVLDESLTFV